MQIRSRSIATVAVLVLAAASLSACAAPASAHASVPVSVATPAASASERALSDLEKAHHSRLGFVAVDTATGRSVSHRSGERFAFASTNKVFIAATVLSQSSVADLDTVVHYTSADLLAYAPITSRFVATGMTVRELLDAMLRFSDNTAANLLVGRLGGPAVVEQYLRGIGDRTTSVDRVEPDLNQAIPGDSRDTTTPAQFARDLRTVILGTDLNAGDRTLLRNDMLDNTTGDAAIRAGTDPSWPIADKTGTGDRGVRNDIAVIYPTGRAPIITVVMTAPDDPNAPADDALVAAATHVGIEALTRQK